MVDLELANYITQYYSNFFTKEELLAWRHWSTNYKLINGTYGSEDQRESRRKLNVKVGWMTEDPEILQLLQHGIDQFKIDVANRILNNHQEEIHLNRCPECNGLTRTPRSKQCHHCYHKWHSPIKSNET